MPSIRRKAAQTGEGRIPMINRMITSLLLIVAATAHAAAEPPAITPVGTITADPARIHLWDGTFTSEVTTDKGSMQITAFTAEESDVVVIRVAATGAEAGASIVDEPFIYLESLDDIFDRSSTEGEVHITVHPYNGEGDRTVGRW